jgi:hypothetical protein
MPARGNRRALLPNGARNTKQLEKSDWPVSESFSDFMKARGAAGFGWEGG